MVDAFNASIEYDQRLYHEDIRGSIAHTHMLAKTGIISESDAEKIVKGLTSILDDIEKGTFEFKTELEDIHMNVEAALTERIGDAGARLHTARSRNDQVALDMHMYMKRVVTEVMDLVIRFEEALLMVADKNQDTLMPGYTHLQRAQPITFCHHLLAYFNMFLRDFRRLEGGWKGADIMPLGAGAVAGTTLPIDRFQVAEELNFDAVYGNSMDAVSARDYLLEFLSAASILMMHLSRFSEEIILWCSWEFKFVELDDAYSTGSSIMPQKKNPDVAELVRGKTGRVYGSLITLLTIMKGLPLAYNKDMQEDKEPVFDAIDTVEQCLPVFAAMVDTLTVKNRNMQKAAAGGFINATDCADYLVKKGLPFRDAYMIVGRLVHMCIKTGETLDTLPLKDFQSVSGAFGPDVYQALEVKTCVGGRKVYGGPAPDSVKTQIEHIKEFVEARTE